MSSTGRKKSGAAAKEKRLSRTRGKITQPLEENKGRAMRENILLLEMPSPTEIDEPLYCLPTERRSDAAMDFEVSGSKADPYIVTLDFRPRCSCPNFKNKEDVCKHMFFVLIKVLNLPRDSPILYQKAYLSTELQEIYEYLEEAHQRKSVLKKKGVLATKKARVEYKARKSLPQRSDMVQCHKCRYKFDMLPDIGGLSLTYSSRKNPTRTFAVECPNCHEIFEHDEGNTINLADVTGQSRVRDKSSYRPTPGYPGWEEHLDSRNRSRYYY